MTLQVIDTTQKFAGQSQERGALSLLMTATEPSLTGKPPVIWPTGRLCACHCCRLMCMTAAWLLSRADLRLPPGDSPTHARSCSTVPLTWVHLVLFRSDLMLILHDCVLQYEPAMLAPSAVWRAFLAGMF